MKKICTFVLNTPKVKEMAQLIVTVEDASLLSDLKRAIKMLRGVTNISERKSDSLNDVTKQAIADAREGRTIKCDSFEDYLRKVQ